MCEKYHRCKHAVNATWILPLAILIYSFAETPVLSPWESLLSRPVTVQARLSYYFGWGCQTCARCFNQLVITMPFYASVAYSFGALRTYRNLDQCSFGGSVKLALGLALP